MEHALVLSVFGEAKLLQGEETVLTAPLPLLIAAFVVIEHNGEAASREAVFQYFFPQEPIAPNVFSELSRVIYQQLWRHLAQSPSNPLLYLTTDFLQEQTGQVLSKSYFQRAHVQLQDYAIIEQALQKEQGYQYRVDSRLQRYLTADGKTGTDKVQLARKTFSAHLSTLRAKAPECVPAGKTGASRQALIIQLPCTATCLEQALQSCEVEKIRELYGAPFLLNIEQACRSDLWLSPLVRSWIKEQRATFEQQVQRVLQKATDKVHSPMFHQSPVFHPMMSVQPMAFQPVVEGRLPSYLRRHLLNKTDEECAVVLQGNRSGWISTSVSVQRGNLWSGIQVEARDPALLPLFLEKSYGFAVLLGEAGMGKTLVLCHLAQALIQQAREDVEKPIPLVLHLADWARRGGAFAAWLKYRLVRLGVGGKRGDRYLEQLLNAQQCLLLLDGFDNLPPLQRPVYLQRLNRFVSDYGEAHLGGIILASRPEEYRVAYRQFLSMSENAVDFYFRTEALLQPLTQSVAQVYLATHTPMSSAHTKDLFAMSGLNEFLHIPLGLTLFAHTAQQSANILDAPTDSTEEIKQRLIGNYVKEQLADMAHSSTKKSLYSAQQVETWLAYLARYLNMGETFHLEHLSPRLLTPVQQQRYQSAFVVIFATVFGLMMGSVAGLIFGKRVANQVIELPKPPVTEGFFYAVHDIFQYWDKYGDWGDKLTM